MQQFQVPKAVPCRKTIGNVLTTSCCWNHPCCLDLNVVLRSSHSNGRKLFHIQPACNHQFLNMQLHSSGSLGRRCHNTALDRPMQSHIEAHSTSFASFCRLCTKSLRVNNVCLVDCKHEVQCVHAFTADNDTDTYTGTVARTLTRYH